MKKNLSSGANETSINLELTVKVLEDYIFENYVQDLPNTTSKEMPLDMIRDALIRNLLFLRMVFEFRNHILNQLNRSDAQGIDCKSSILQFQPELQTLIQLMELPIDWTEGAGKKC